MTTEACQGDDTKNPEVNIVDVYYTNKTYSILWYCKGDTYRVVMPWKSSSTVMTWGRKFWCETGSSICRFGSLEPLGKEIVAVCERPWISWASEPISGVSAGPLSSATSKVIRRSVFHSRLLVQPNILLQFHLSSHLTNPHLMRNRLMTGNS